MTPLGILAGLALVAALLLAPRVGGISLWRRFRAFHDRSRSEDALKHILAWQHRSKPASLESLAGGLGLAPSKALQITKRLEAAGWIECGAAGIRLTSGGERRALRVVRAHRLWERYLSDDANMPFGRLHQAAERAEHNLSRQDVERLDAHLGHPQHDPHGDPIPSADGTVAELDAVSLNEWPPHEPASVAHIEDEPDEVFQQVLSAGFRPSMVIRILQSDAAGLVVECDGAERRIDRTVAANVHVTAVRQSDMLPTDALPLSELRTGSTGEVVDLGPACTGFTRRRLLDLGLTPGAHVEVALDNTFGDPRAFRIRGTAIALREEQAAQVWVRSRATQEGPR